MAEQDDARVQEIRARYVGLEKLLQDTTGQWDRSQLLHMVSELAGAAKTIPYLLERLDALTAERGKWFDCYMGAVRLAQRSGQERDDALARLAAAEAALFGVALRMDLDDLQGCWCVRPKSGSHEHACVAARAALAGSREQERE